MAGFPLRIPPPKTLLPYEAQLWSIQLQFESRARSLQSPADRKLAVDNAISQNFATSSGDIREAARQYLGEIIILVVNAPNPTADRARIMKDLQTKIFEITQDVTVNKAKTADKAAQQMDAYIRQ